MNKKVFIGVGLVMTALPALLQAQEFTAEDIKQRASDLDSKRSEVIKRLSESISKLEMRDVSVLHAESSKVKQSDLGLDELHGQYRIKLQEGEVKVHPEQ